ncbi:ARM repeat-containing protein [Hypoxylon sp. NC1633]|nr:ARM repeat-containing protein [Hypoxylon sp. NC1633]
MPKTRTKRQAIREARKAKRRINESVAQEGRGSAKRQRLDPVDGDDSGYQEATFQDAYDQPQPPIPPHPDNEFFGLLSDEEQKYFHAVDDQLTIDEFPSQDERELYLASVFAEVQGKELKLACSQSCSRLMERLIIMSNTRQKKQLFLQLASHFLVLIRHRFASHCCETLFLQSAPIVTKELGGERDDVLTDYDEPDERPLPYMEELFLFALDELDGHLGSLLAHKFGSHTLRVLLIILSGRPLEESETKLRMHKGKRRKSVSVPWKSDSSTGSNTRAVPLSFNRAAKKIIADSTFGMHITELRILATSFTGNPTLQLLLELDATLNLKADDESGDMKLLWLLLPGAPASLSDATTPASDFVNFMIYDPLGSRLLETIVRNCPGKVFKALYKHIFGNRMHSLMRNDIASYPAICVLERLSKEDLAVVVQKTLPEFGKLVAQSKLNVIKVLFERCHVRQASSELKSLTKALVDAFGSDPKSLVTKLCLPPLSEIDNEGGDERRQQKLHELRVSHGSFLTTTMLAIPGPPTDTVQASLATLSDGILLELAVSLAQSHVLIDAFMTPTQNRFFHKMLAAALVPHSVTLASSAHGYRVLQAMIEAPSKGDGISIPFHLKESIMNQLSQNRREVRTFFGKRTWRLCKGELWVNRRGDWVTWAKGFDSLSNSNDRAIVKGAGKMKEGRWQWANDMKKASSGNQ